jgi:hypothetical protein
MNLIFKISLFILLCVTCSFLNSSCKKKEQCYTCYIQQQGVGVSEPVQEFDNVCDPIRLRDYKWMGCKCDPL